MKKYFLLIFLIILGLNQSLYSQSLDDNLSFLMSKLSNNPLGKDIYYDIMSYYARKCNREKATFWLEKLVRIGYRDFDRIYSDSSMSNIIGFERFGKIIKEQSDLIKERRNNKTKKIKSKLETETLSNRNGDIKSKYLYNYDMNGILIDKIFYTNKDKPDWKWHYKYDNYYNLSDITEFNSANKLAKITSYRYNNRFNLLSVVQIDNKTVAYQYEFTYDKYDNMVSAYKYDNSESVYVPGLVEHVKKIKIFYDAFGHIIEQDIYDDHNENEIIKKRITIIDSLVEKEN
jgi:hypothetical protein